MRNTNIKKFPLRLAAIAACAAALTVAAIAVVYTNNYMVNSLISLDVNPSIEVQVNKQDKVLKVTARNEDAQKILEDIELKNTKLSTAIHAIMGSMIKNGYITPEKNSVLVTVKNDNQQKSQQLTETVTESIDQTLGESNVKANVFNLNGEKKGIVNQGIAKKFDVSEGKLAFIVTLARLDPSLTLEQLSKMTIDELADLIKERNIDISHIIKLDELRNLDSLDGLIDGKPNGKDKVKHPKDSVNSGSVPPKKTEEKYQNGKPAEKSNNGNKPESKPNNGKSEEKSNNGNKPESKSNNGKSEEKSNNDNKPDNDKSQEKTNNGNSKKSDPADNTPKNNQNNGKSNEKQRQSPITASLRANSHRQPI